MASQRGVNEVTPPVLKKPGEGHVHPGFPQMVLKADSEATRGAYTMHEDTLPPGEGGPPVHTHLDQEEAFYVIEGELTMLLGEELISAPAGTFVLVPAGWRHGFANRSNSAVRMLGIFSPRGFDHGFEEIGEWIARGGEPDEGHALSEKYGVVIKGPPLG